MKTTTSWIAKRRRATLSGNIVRGLDGKPGVDPFTEEGTVSGGVSYGVVTSALVKLTLNGDVEWPNVATGRHYERCRTCQIIGSGVTTDELDQSRSMEKPGKIPKS